MFDIGWSEMAVIAILALIVIGPKDLPSVLKTVGHWVRKARSLAREFQSGVDEMIRDADLEDAKKMIGGARNLDVDSLVEDAIDPTGSIKEEARDLEVTARTESPAESAATTESAAPSESDEAPKATIINHPVQVAPPHSLTPPPEEPESAPEPAPELAPEPAEDGSQKRA